MSDGLPSAGTAEAESLRVKTQAEHDATQREIEQIEQKLTSLEGDKGAEDMQRLALLETKRAVQLNTIRRLTFDRDKQLRAGVCSEDDISAEIDAIEFDRSSSTTWLGYGVVPSADRDRLQSIAIAISRLKSAAVHARMMERIRYRAMSAAIKPGDPLVW